MKGDLSDILEKLKKLQRDLRVLESSVWLLPEGPLREFLEARTSGFFKDALALEEQVRQGLRAIRPRG